jgi:hypothetical protein
MQVGVLRQIVHRIYQGIFFLFIARKECTACSRTSYRSVLLISSNKYLYSDKGKIKVNIHINDKSEKFLKKKNTATEHSDFHKVTCKYISYPCKRNTTFPALFSTRLIYAQQHYVQVCYTELHLNRAMNAESRDINLLKP